MIDHKQKKMLGSQDFRDVINTVLYNGAIDTVVHGK